MSRRTKPRDPWTQALDALSRRALSVAELRAKLARLEHAPDTIDAVIAKLRRLALVDDRSVAYNHARHRQREGKRGPARVRAELQRRGIPRELCDEVLSEVFPPEQDEELFQRALERLGSPRGREQGRPAREKVARRLLRAGFPGARVSRWLAEGDVDWLDDEFDEFEES